VDDYHVRIYGVNIEEETLLWLKSRIEKVLNVIITINTKDVTPGFVLKFLDEERDQIDAELLIQALMEKIGVAPTQRVLVIIAADGYVEGLNFVFGVAKNEWGGIVFTERLNPAFYGEAYSEELYRVRILKEVLHELGHSLGLEHCRENCVMRFSNSVYDVDAKPTFFCKKCLAKLNFSHPGIIRAIQS